MHKIFDTEYAKPSKGFSVGWTDGLGFRPLLNLLAILREHYITHS
jgi:hypothetical protein